jgi:NTP pyrophosphatase (non-canonical NTP hydrolase)
MTFNEYQKLARSTAVYPEEYKVIYPALGLCGEAGEVADKIKKTVRGDDPLYKVSGEIALELGDVLWYIAALADDLGVDLETIAKWNTDKLQRRMKSNKIKGDGDNR